MKGKEWERQVGAALRFAGCQYNLNGNNEKPVCDWRSLYHGRSVLVECKETATHRLAFRCITANERRHLNQHMNAGGYSLILVSRVGPNTRQAWACEWMEWLRLEDNSMGKSISLIYPPECFMPLARMERDYSLGPVWDIRPILEGAI